MNEPVVAEISVVPLGTATTSVSRYVAACLKVLDGVPEVSYQLTAMGTIVQGPLARVLELAGRMHAAPFEIGVERVLTTIKIDDRRDKPVTIEGKVSAVERAIAAGN